MVEPKMSRIKRSLVSQIKDQQEFEKQQNELKRKHRIEEKNVIVVEKSNMTKFLIRTIGNVVRISTTILILLLASIGLTTLLYPQIRNELLIIINQIINQLVSFFQRKQCNKKEATAIASFQNFKLQLYLTINKNSNFYKIKLLPNTTYYTLLMYYYDAFRYHVSIWEVICTKFIYTTYLLYGCHLIVSIILEENSVKNR